MGKATKMFVLIVSASVFMFLTFVPVATQALTEQEIIRATHIVNLEASPVWFKPDQPIDFIVTVKYDGGTQDGFDVGIFHENRLVGWETNKRLHGGSNTFKIHDSNFKGDSGSYIVKLRYKGHIFTQKAFSTKSHCAFTIDPRATFPQR
jgi:hypothetical protein